MLCLGLGPVSAQSTGTYDFLPVSGGNSAANAALDGFRIYDTFRGSAGQAYAGEMGLVFADQSAYTGTQTPANTFRADADGPLPDQLGLWGYCVDITSPWRDNTTQSRQFRATTIADADLLYRQQGVTGYLAGGLHRAAYLVDSYSATVKDQDQYAAAALQAAIWEVLYDANPSVTEGAGNYFVRNHLGTSQLSNDMTHVQTLANGYLSTAAANQWGAGSFDPANRVVVWMPTDLQASSFQSLLTVNPQELPVQYGGPIPEPGTLALALLSPVLLFRRRR